MTCIPYIVKTLAANNEFSQSPLPVYVDTSDEKTHPYIRPLAIFVYLSFSIRKLPEEVLNTLNILAKSSPILKSPVRPWWRTLSKVFV